MADKAIFVVRDEQARDKSIMLTKQFLKANNLAGRVSAWITNLERQNKDIAYTAFKSLHDKVKVIDWGNRVLIVSSNSADPSTAK